MPYLDPSATPTTQKREKSEDLVSPSHSFRSQEVVVCVVVSRDALKAEWAQATSRNVEAPRT